mmetsp:Transcript_17136/g.29012  ORF Transcript_17136/g.29012 Transcript_17136/m.29012 type:complete len:200 (-) Transcript_17136:28-627(-)
MQCKLLQPWDRVVEIVHHHTPHLHRHFVDVDAHLADFLDDEGGNTRVIHPGYLDQSLQEGLSPLSSQDVDGSEGGVLANGLQQVLLVAGVLGILSEVEEDQRVDRTGRRPQHHAQHQAVGHAEARCFWRPSRGVTSISIRSRGSRRNTCNRTTSRRSTYHCSRSGNSGGGTTTGIGRQRLGASSSSRSGVVTSRSAADG